MSKNSLEVHKSYLQLALFQQAFIHKSVSSVQNNERLEFLGDAVLEIVISEYLFNRFEGLNEGKLTQMRASLVNTQSLAKLFQQLDCKDLLQTSKGTNKLDETHKHSIYAGAFEACIGAIFIELVGLAIVSKLSPKSGVLEQLTPLLQTCPPRTPPARRSPGPHGES